MKDHPNLASRSEVMLIYKCSTKIWSAKQNIKFWTTFSATSALDTASPERNVTWTNKNTSVYLQRVRHKVTYFPWPVTQTAEIRLLQHL